MSSLKTLRWAGLSREARERVLRRPAASGGASRERAVRRIIERVRVGGDRAVRAFTRRFDGASLGRLEIPARDLDRAVSGLPPPILKALRRAAAQIETFHAAQLPRRLSVEVSPGVRCAREARPIDRVGLYVPGGTAPLVSTVLMLGIPARLAGCRRRVLCTPPGKDGRVHPGVLAAARLCGIRRVFCVGGAQAIAAMAYGTESVPKVDKIFGPGNDWVAKAKALAAADPRGAACDLPAGPSEVMVIADGAADPVFVAADLLSQAEHGPDSQAALVSTDESLLDRTRLVLARQLRALPRRAAASRALSRSFFIRVRSLTQALQVADEYAPEHLILQVRGPESWAARVSNAGSIFLGPWSPEAAGDYASGANHVLPTYGAARAFGGVSVESFMKFITLQKLTRKGLASIAPAVETLAELEGLIAHKRAVSLRLRGTA